LWAGVDWQDFTSKWNELSSQGLQLIDVKPYDDGGSIKWAGVWGPGNDGHYLWASDWPTFNAKWNELSGEGLRLVALDTYEAGATRMWVGAWRAGTDGHYLWAGVDWNGFTAKWAELANDGLRLTDLATYVENGQRKWAGVWRAGSDGYELWLAPDMENFLGQWDQSAHNGMRLVSIETLDASCQGDCCNHVVSHDANNQPAPYIYGVTGDPGGPYRWPVDDNQYVRISALSFNAQPFNLPFNDSAVARGGTWIYGSAPPPQGHYHHAIDYSRSDRHTFEVRAAAPGKVVFVGWDDWSGNTIIVSHDVDGVADAFRTIYMHLRNGPNHDIDAAWNKTLPTLTGTTLTNYTNYLNNTGAVQNSSLRHPNSNYWGTDAQAIDPGLVGRTVAAGDHLAWAGCTGPGGFGGSGSPSQPNTHLHIFFTRRDPSDGNWYFVDPYGVYSYPSAGYPPGVTDAATGPCVRYSVAWKGGKPQYP
jgi:hypothetical protein